MTYSAADTRYDNARFRRSGRSGLKLPEFSLGLWQNFGDNRNFETQREIVLRAFDLGITHFDLANRYGPPFRAAEKAFGRILGADLGRYRDEILIASKAGNPIGASPYLAGGSRKTLLDSLDISLTDLGVDHVDIFYSHSPDLETPLEETIGALSSAVQQGKALYIGISNYTAERAHDAAVIADRLGTPLLVHQSRYSIFDRTVELGGHLDTAAQDGTGVVAFSPLAQGLLTDKYLQGEVPADSRAASSTFLSADDISDEYISRAGFLNKIAESRGQSLAQLAVQWVLRRPEVTTALIGASSTAQLEHNLAATEFPDLTEDELTRIDEYGIHGTVLRPKR
ncbi:aldo/keto reductase [Rhodococcoides yunnanense]|uniref:aldo/keto reductase n=1 Tax=Rhodococcoides yunnanense TaxID=278209 RepID=UPI000932738E|nr:aldo/keto reductase [Rhodococcus yunnanensis]